MRFLLLGLTLFGLLQAFDEKSVIAREQSEQIRLGLRLVDALASARLNRLPEMFQPGFEATALKQSMASLWQNQILIHGRFQQAKGAVIRHEDYHPTVYIRLDFARRQRGLKLTLLLNAPWRIQKVETVDPKDIPTGLKPERSYVDAGRFEVLPVNVGPEDAGLRGGFYRPKGVVQPNIVLFLHDFGPQSATHRIGLNDVFLDFAEGLASHDQAVLLLPRRSYIYSPRSDEPLTPQWEVVDDVFASLHTLRQEGWLKPGQKVYLAGYGYGSWFLPWFARKGLVDGLILMNPSFRHPLNILFEIEEIRQASNPSAYQDLLQLSSRVDQFFQGKMGRRESLFGYPAAYFEALELYRPEPLNQLDLPVLMLFARHDFVQNPADEPEFFRILEKTRVQRVDFEDLNRVFHTGSGNPEEDNFTPGAVNARVIHELVDFLKKQ